MTRRDRKKRMETGPDSAGQGGATQQISDTPIADSESVEELAEEGNAFEADAIYGVENARDPEPYALPLSRGSPLKVGCSADQSQMCECLREIAKILSYVVSPSHLRDQLRRKALVSPRFLSNSVPFSRISKSEAEQASWRSRCCYVDTVNGTERNRTDLVGRQRAIRATEHSIVFWQVSCCFV
jgi:hypothetical protein